MHEITFPRRLAAEFIGTAGLVCGVVGSGIMAERLAQGDQAIALLANTIATGAILFVLIVGLAPVSGAHFNPAVSIVMIAAAKLPIREALSYIAFQVTGAALGTIIANTMFGLGAINISSKGRSGSELILAEAVATFGLIGAIVVVSRQHTVVTTAASVALFITGAYWFTSSTSFANPAVTIARSLTDTFTGIRPSDVLPFVMAQLLGGGLSVLVFNWLVPAKKDD